MGAIMVAAVIIATLGDTCAVFSMAANINAKKIPAGKPKK